MWTLNSGHYNKDPWRGVQVVIVDVGNQHDNNEMEEVI